jgi:hypothetical protein
MNLIRAVATITAAIVLVLFSSGTARAQATAPSTAPAGQPPEPGKVSLVGPLPAELKVKRAKTGHLLVSPKIDGHEAGWFIFDTGAGMSCVDKALAERLALPHAADASALGEGGTQQTRLLKIKSLQLGPVLVEDSTVVELNLKPIALAMGEQIDGVIGYECFLPGVFEVDLDAGRITVHDHAAYTLPDRHAWEKLSFKGRRPRLPGQIEDNEPGLFLFDLGANSSLTVYAPTVERFKLLEGRQTSAAMSGGVGGIHAARKGTIGSITLAGERIDDVPAVFAQSKQGTSGTEQEVFGSVGVGLLKRFVLVLNYRDQTVGLIPKK